MNDATWVMPFGKYKGQPISEVPSGYLRWLLDSDAYLRDDTRTTLETELAARGSGTAETPSEEPCRQSGSAASTTSPVSGVNSQATCPHCGETVFVTITSRWTTSSECPSAPSAPPAPPAPPNELAF